MKFSLEFCPICYDILTITDETKDFRSPNDPKVEFQKTYGVEYNIHIGRSTDNGESNSKGHNFRDQVCLECRDALSKTVDAFMKVVQERTGVNQKKIDITDLHNWKDVETAAAKKKSFLRRLIPGPAKVLVP